MVAAALKHRNLHLVEVRPGGGPSPGNRLVGSGYILGRDEVVRAGRGTDLWSAPRTSIRADVLVMPQRFSMSPRHGETLAAMGRLETRRTVDGPAMSFRQWVSACTQRETFRIAAVAPAKGATCHVAHRGQATGDGGLALPPS
jgi:hypothetical protein